MNRLFINISFKIVFLIFTIVSFSSFLYSQESPSPFDERYLEVVTSIANTDLDKAIEVTDSLYHHSGNSLHKMKSALLMALLYENKGEIAEAVNWATKTEKIALKEKDFEYQVRSSGYLATLYRRLDLNVESFRHIRKAEKANAQRKSESNYDAIQSTIHHEKAFHEIEKFNYDEALLELEQSEKYLFSMEDGLEKNYQLALIYESYAECYLGLEEYDKAKKKAKQSLNLQSQQDPELIAVLQNHLGRIALHHKEYDKAIEHLKLAEQNAEHSQNLAVQYLILSNLRKYHTEIGDFEKSNQYGYKVNEIKNKRTANIKEVSNEILEKMYIQEDKTSKSNQILIWITAFLIISVTATFILMRLKSKKQIIKYKKLIQRVKAYEELNKEIPKAKVNPKNSLPVNNTNPKEHPKNSTIMTLETEERLLEELEKLEEEKFFLKKDLTLSSLTSEINSNARYVSHVIKNHKHNDFNGYINELRVFYVIHLLREEPKYLKCKLTDIADQSGFSSHSKFTQVFKKVTGLTPSAFIVEVKKENKNLSVQ